jgi:hypothetical protein
MASTLNNSRPTGSVGSCTDVPRASLTSRAASSSAIARASGSDRGKPIELHDHKRVTGAARRQCLPPPRPVTMRPGQAVVDVGALRVDAERLQGVALGGQVLGIGGDAGVADLELGHARKCVPLGGRSPARSTEPPLRHTAGPLSAEVPAQGEGCAGRGSRYAMIWALNA